MKRLVFRPEYLAVAAAAAILFYLLMFRPITGVADNGDFPRIMGAVGLQYCVENNDGLYFGYVNRLYKVTLGMPMFSGYFSTEIPIVIVAVILSQMAKNNWLFDIRYLSALYSIVFLASVYLLVKYGPTRYYLTKYQPLKFQPKQATIEGWLAAALIVFVFADNGYVTYFNSLYGEAVTLVFLLFVAGSCLWLLASWKPRLRTLAAFFAGALLFAGAKVQNCPAGIMLALFCLGLAGMRKDRLWRRLCIISSAAVLLVSVGTYLSESPEIKVCNKYQTVFYGILKGSPDPAADLAELGLDPKYKVLAGTNYFMEDYPIDIRNAGFKSYLYSNVNHFKIVGFYLKHPSRLLQKLELSARNAFKLKQGFGNYEKYPGVKFGQTSGYFGLWSDFKQRVLPHSLLFIFLFYFTFMLGAVLEYFRKRSPSDSKIDSSSNSKIDSSSNSKIDSSSNSKIDSSSNSLSYSFSDSLPCQDDPTSLDHSLLAARRRLYFAMPVLIGLIGLAGFLLPVIGDGEADLSKHLFLFNVCFDLMSVTGIVYMAHLAVRLGRSLKCRASRSRTERTGI